MNLFSEYEHRGHFVSRGLYIAVVPASGERFIRIYMYIYHISVNIAVYMYAGVVNIKA